MSDVATLKSYLVDLGFSVDRPSLAQFTSVIKGAADLTHGSVATIAKDIIKWEAEVVGLFTAVAGAVVTTMDKVAMADQEYRLFGERMFMDTAHAKSLKIALDALGEPLEAIAFDPELHARFVQLQKDQEKLAKGLGGGFEGAMKGIRDIRFEFTRLEVELEYLTQGVVAQIFKQLGLGSGDLVTTLRQLNDYIIQHVPEWSREFATDVIPVLKDTWEMFKAIWGVVRLLGVEFTHVIGLLTNDSGLQKSTGDFHSFARGVEDVVLWLTKLIRLNASAAKFGLNVFGEAGHGAAAVFKASQHDYAGAWDSLKQMHDSAGSAAENAKEAWGIIRSPWTFSPSDAQNFLGSDGSGTADVQAIAGVALGSADVRQKAQALAQQLSPSLNIPADILYAQWAHETGNFTNSGSTQLNNLAGIKLPNSEVYRTFSSIGSFGAYYADQIRRNYAGAMGTKDVDSFATALNHGRIGSWYGDTLQNYEKGMKAHLPTHSGVGGPIDSSVTIGAIHITQPGASAEQISNAVVAKVQDMQKKRIQRNLVELTSAYG